MIDVSGNLKVQGPDCEWWMGNIFPAVCTKAEVSWWVQTPNSNFFSAAIEQVGSWQLCGEIDDLSIIPCSVGHLYWMCVTHYLWSTTVYQLCERTNVIKESALELGQQNLVCVIYGGEFNEQ
jgi:hypothetical protein